MGLLDLLFKRTQVEIGILQLDASLSETHSKTNEVTVHPVEGGFEITDHIRRQREKVEIRGIVSNTPIIFLNSVRAKSPLKNDVTPLGEESRVDIAYRTLQELADAGELITIVTSLREYQNMVIESFNVNRDVTTGNVLDATISLVEVIQVFGEAFKRPEPIKKANTSSSSKGTQPVKNAADSAANKARKSALEATRNAVKKLLSPIKSGG